MRLINEDRTYSDVRRYYLFDTKRGPALIVCRNGLTNVDLMGATVDASVGRDMSWPGFCAEADIGKPRGKVTIYRLLPRQRRLPSLGKILSKRGDLWKS